MSAQASITVFLQALGGKFLGPNAFGNTGIKVALSVNGNNTPIPYQVIVGTTDDGIISQGFTYGSSSFLPILKKPVLAGRDPSVFYLSPGPDTISGTATFALPATPVTATLSAVIPSPSGQALLMNQPVLLYPQQTVYRIVMVIPGLLLTLNTTNPVPGAVSVFVAMMCGCKVTQGLPTSYWSANDFAVNAIVRYKNNSVVTVVLTQDLQTNDSLFSAAVADAENISSVCFTAQQSSTGNYGSIVQNY